MEPRSRRITIISMIPPHAEPIRNKPGRAERWDHATGSPHDEAHICRRPLARRARRPLEARLQDAQRERNPWQRDDFHHDRAARRSRRRGCAQYADTPQRALVERTLDRYKQTAVAIAHTDGPRGLALLDALDLEAVYLYEKHPNDFRRLRDALNDTAAAEVLLHWREYFGLKRRRRRSRSADCRNYQAFPIPTARGRPSTPPRCRCCSPNPRA